MSSEKCTATRKDGKGCRMAPLPGTSPPTCWNHAPDRDGDRALGRRAGGTARGRQQQRAAATGAAGAAGAAAAPEGVSWAPLADAGQIADALREVARRCLDGSLSTREGTVAVQALKQLAPLVEAQARARVAAAAASKRAKALGVIPTRPEEGYAWGARVILQAIAETLSSPHLAPEVAIRQLGHLSIPLGHLLKPAEIDAELRDLYAAAIDKGSHELAAKLARDGLARRGALEDEGAADA